MPTNGSGQTGSVTDKVTVKGVVLFWFTASTEERGKAFWKHIREAGRGKARLKSSDGHDGRIKVVRRTPLKLSFWSVNKFDGRSIYCAISFDFAFTSRVSATNGLAAKLGADRHALESIA